MQKRWLQTVGISLTLGAVACGSGSDDSGAAGSPGAAGTGTVHTGGSGGSGTATAGSSSGVAGSGTSTGGSLGTAGSGGSSTGTAGTGSGTAGSGTAGTGAGGTTGSAGSGGSSAGAGGTVASTKFVGNITTQDQMDTGGLTFSKYWDEVTPENAGKWGSVQASATSAFNWATLDAIYDYTEKNHVIFKQHNFVWGSQQPSGTVTEQNVKDWISAFCTRYPDTKLIDVVNEPPPHTTPPYADAIGGGTNTTWQWITNAFTWARASCGNAILILNDYNNVEYGSEESHFISIVNAIKTAGAPIDAVGAQSHDVNKLSVATLQANLATLNTMTGLPIYITEYDVSNTDDNGQLTTYQQQFPVFLNTTYVHGITIWGWIYGQTWSQAPDSGLVKAGKSRPAMTWLMQQLGRTAP